MTDIFRYLAVGVANTAVGLGCIYGSQATFELDDVQANLFGYSVAVLLSFVANRSWTFAHRGDALPALARFLAVLAAAWLANLAAVLAARDLLHIAPPLAQLAGIVPYTAIGFLGSRHFAFPRETSRARETLAKETT